MNSDLDLSKLSHAEKDALILSLVAQLQAALARIGELEKRVAELQRPPKTPDNSSMPPSQGQKSNTADDGKRGGPRTGSGGRKGGGRELVADPDETVIARAARCQYCQSALADADQTLDARYDKIDLPRVRPAVHSAEV